VALALQISANVMRRLDSRPAARRSRNRRAGVVYVEQLLSLLAGLCIAALLYTAAVRLLQPRFARIAGALASSTP
jgi:hypothetical protein